MEDKFPPVLDVCCGSRMFWFDKEDDRVIFLDKRQLSIKIDIGTPGTKGRKPIDVFPNIQGSFTSLPFRDNTFLHVVFDPPHLFEKAGTGIISLKYGKLPGAWENEIRKGFHECFRVLTPGGTLIFKWSAIEIPISNILKLIPYRPLYGHRSGKKSNTHWVAFIKHLDNKKNE